LKDYFTDCGLLRLNLRSDYEKADVIEEILKQIGTLAFAMFSCRRVATKAVPAAKERTRALAALGYVESEHALAGHDGRKIRLCKRIEPIFDFAYKWEIYTPKRQRIYGYYVLPVLYRDRFASRMELQGVIERAVRRFERFCRSDEM